MRLANFTALMVSELAVDPSLLGRKADRYLAGKSFPLLKRVSFERILRKISNSSTEIARLEDLRLYTDACEQLKKSFRAHPIRLWEKYRLKKQLENLDCRIAESRTIKENKGEIRTLLYFTNSSPYTRSGYTERSNRVINCQRDSGIEIFAATRYNYPLSIGVLDFPRNDSIDGVKFYRLVPNIISLSRGKQKQRAVRQLVELCSKLEIDILQTTTGFQNAEIVSLAAKALDIPWTYEVRGELEETWVSKFSNEDEQLARKSDYYRLARQNEEKAMQMAACVITLSEVSKTSLVNRGIESRKIEVIPNGIDQALLGHDLTKTAARKRVGLEVDKVYVGSVTSVVGYEGLDILVRALKHLPEHISGVVVGDGEALASVKSLVDSLGLSDRMIFPGRKSQDCALDWYKALDVFVVPRRNMAVCQRVTPIKATNAQALGLPVVLSDLAALREVTGGHATFVNPEDPKALATGILSALEGDVPLAPLHWLESRSWSANGKRYDNILRGSAFNWSKL